MKRSIDQLENRVFDVVIIGGGISGACLAHDAALRGLQVALLEKDDFGMSTSAASSKLLHGGIRYLQKLQFGKVRESARERTYFQVLAPHITSYIPFLIPTVDEAVMKGKMALTAGMNLYRLLCTGLNDRIADSDKKVPYGRLHSRSEAVKLVPLLRNIHGLTGAYTLYESHMHNSERMTLAFLKTAAQNGAVVANHARVTGLVRDGSRICGVSCLDTLSGRDFTVTGTIVVNAAGPFIPDINRTADGLKLRKDTTGFSKGVHLVTRQIEESFALALSSGKKTEGILTRGGRHIFIIPWRGRSLIGTTNVPYKDDLEKIRVTRKDITDFLVDINAILPGVHLTETDVYYAFTGLYPLISDEIKIDTYQGTGEYQVVDHAAQDAIEGIVSVLGAKYTTARAIAEQGLDLIERKLQRSCTACQTASTPLLEGKITNLQDFIHEKQRHYKGLLAPEIIRSLITAHGSAVDAVIDYLACGEGYLERLCRDRETLVGEVAYAVEYEMACSLDDVIFARTGLGTIGHPGTRALERAADLMAELLGWNEEKRRDEIARVNERYRYSDS